LCTFVENNSAIKFYAENIEIHIRGVQFLCILIFSSKVRYVLPKKAMHGIQVFTE